MTVSQLDKITESVANIDEQEPSRRLMHNPRLYEREDFLGLLYKLFNIVKAEFL